MNDSILLIGYFLGMYISYYLIMKFDNTNMLSMVGVSLSIAWPIIIPFGAFIGGFYLIDKYLLKRNG